MTKTKDCDAFFKAEHRHDNPGSNFPEIYHEDSLPGEHLNNPASVQPPGLFSNNTQNVYYTEIDQCNLAYHTLKLENEKLMELNGLLERKVAILEESTEE